MLIFFLHSQKGFALLCRGKKKTKTYPQLSHPESKVLSILITLLGYLTIIHRSLGIISRLSNTARNSGKHCIFKNSVTVTWFPQAISLCSLPYNALLLSPENKHLVCSELSCISFFPLRRSLDSFVNSGYQTTIKKKNKTKTYVQNAAVNISQEHWVVLSHIMWNYKIQSEKGTSHAITVIL